MPFTAQDVQELMQLLETDPQLRGALRAVLWKPEDLADWLRSQLPRLLQEDPRLGAEVVGILAQTLSPRSELVRVLEEIAALREDFGRRFEAVDRRFEAVDRRFEAVDRRFEALQREMAERFEAVDRRFEALQREMAERFEAVDRRFEALQQEMDRRFEAVRREMDQRFALQAAQLASVQRGVWRLTVAVGSLGRRFGVGFEEAVRAIVEEFAGLGPLTAERLTVQDDAGEVFGAPGSPVEFDAWIHNGRRFLVEVKAFADPEDVLLFHRKATFASRKLGEPFEPVLIAPFAHPRALELARQLGIQVLPGGEEEEPGGAG